MLTLQRTSKCTVTNNEDGKYGFADKLTKRKDRQGDLTIMINDQSTSVHRSVLMATSDYFKTMFSAGFMETDTDTLDLSNMFEDVAEMDDILDFMYTGKIELTNDNIVSVLNTACHFLQTDLQEYCALFLKANISPKTCVPVFVLADRYNLSEVQAICIEVMGAWLPLGLCKRHEVLDLSPYCLNIFVKEDILRGLSENNKRELLQKWHENLKSTSEESSPHLLEQSSVLCEEGSLEHYKLPQEDFQMSGPSYEKDVLFFVFKIPSSESTKCCAEVHAFVPEHNMWKFVLCHMFDDSVKPTADPHLVGITTTKAYFVFVKDLQNSEEECLVSVSLQTGASTVIKLPDGVSIKRSACYGGYPEYFLWGEDLCGLFCGIKGEKTWSLYKCVEDEEWEELIQELPIDDDWAALITVVFNDTLYIWWKEFSICGSALAYIEYNFCKVAKSTETEQYEKCNLKPAIEVDADGGEYPDWDYYTLASIATDAEADTLSYTHIIGTWGDDGEVLDEHWEDQHTSIVLTYGINTNSWHEGDVCEIPYPKPDFTINPPTMREFQTKSPIMKPLKRLVVNGDGEDTVKRCVPEACVGGLYYMKTMSPYNTSLWKLNKKDAEESHWELITHLPYSLDWFPHIQTAKVASDWLLKLPDSCFHDFSEEVGQSLMAAWSEKTNSVRTAQLKFDEELYPYGKCEQLCGKLWEEGFNISKST